MPDEVKTRYGTAEWCGQDFTSLNAPQRVAYALHALGVADVEPPACPFQPNQPPCSKKGGVCSIHPYAEDSNKRLQAAETLSREYFETALRSRLRPL